MELSCGHQGVEVWRSADGKTVAVQGTVKRCDVCMKRDKYGGRSPIVYLIQVEESVKIIPK